MKKLYYVHYGMYLNEEGKKVEATFDPEKYTEQQVVEMLEKEAYYESLEIGEGFVGMHGFCPEADDDDDEEVIREAVEDAANYYVKPWNEAEHASSCTYGNQTEPKVEYREFY